MSGSTSILLQSTGLINPRFSNYYRPSNLSLDGYVGLYIFGGTPYAGETTADVLARSCINLLNPSQTCSVVGSPTVDPDGIICDGTNHFISPHSETTDFTFAVMAKGLGGGAQHLVSNYGLPNTLTGAFLYNNAGTADPGGNIRAGYGIDVSGTKSVFQNGNNFDADFMSWSLVLGMAKSGAVNGADVGVYAQDMFSTVALNFRQLTTAGATRSIDAAAGKLRFGGTPASSPTSKAKLRYILVGNRIRTAPERAELTAFIRARAALDGITVPA